MRKIEIVVIEAGRDYMNRLENFTMELPEDKAQAVAEAIKAVEAEGYSVIPDNKGGCTEYVSATDSQDYIAVTVVPSAK